MQTLTNKAACLTFLLFISTPVLAWDYQITVPLRFTDLHPEYPQIAIRCTLIDDPSGSGEIIAQATQVINPHNVGNGEVVIRLDVPERWDPREVKAYRCGWTYPQQRQPGCHPSTCWNESRLCGGPTYRRTPCGAFYEESVRGTLNMGE